jgi:Xaa-Pro dipeptidase
MERRQFLQSGVIGAVAAFGASQLTGAENELATASDIAPEIAALSSRSAAAPPPISEAERVERRDKAQRFMAEQGVSAMLIESGTNLLYFTGVQWGRSERLFGLLLPREGKGIFISPAFEQQRAENLIDGRFDVRVWQEDQSPYALIADTLREWNSASGKLAVDPSGRYFIAHALSAAAPTVQVTTAEPITNACRGRKTPHEVEIMRFANTITVDAYRAALKTLRVGMTQAELGTNITDAFAQLGYPGGAMVLFGESSAYPHGLPKPRTLEQNQVVLIDGGTSVHGYASDITRTVAFGNPPGEVQKVFDIVHEAQAQALRAAAPGKTCGAIDDVARKVVTDAGYGPDYKFFTHRLGHGIGMEGHEWPYLVRGSKVVLEPGMSFSDEPGIYQYGKFGIRLEDIIVITATGAEMLTPSQDSMSSTLV